MDILAKTQHAPGFLLKRRPARHGLRFSSRTVQDYTAWILRFFRYHDTHHPATMGEVEVLDFINWLVANRRGAHSTRMQALSALLFLYRDALRTPLGHLRELVRARSPT
jgi:hypothetical protein